MSSIGLQEIPVCFGSHWDPSIGSGCLRCQAAVFCRECFEHFVKKTELETVLVGVREARKILNQGKEGSMNEAGPES